MFNKVLTILAVIATVFMYANMPKAQVVTEGLISYWTFDEADITGKTVKDVWGNSDGTIMGDPKIVKGKVGEALEFDGEDDYIVTGLETADLPEPTTFVFWMNAQGAGIPLGGYAGHGPNRWNVEYDSEGKILQWLQHEPFKSINANAKVNTNEWVHIAIVHDSIKGELDFYINGSFDSTHEIDNPLTTPNQKLRIAARADGTRPLEGIMDEVRIYGRALSKDEIKQTFTLAVVEPSGKLAISWGKIKVSR